MIVCVVRFAGFRHISLKSNTGDAIPNCSLFVHVAITNKRGGGVSDTSYVNVQNVAAMYRNSDLFFDLNSVLASPELTSENDMRASRVELASKTNPVRERKTRSIYSGPV